MLIDEVASAGVDVDGAAKRLKNYKERGLTLLFCSCLSWTYYI